MKKIGTATLTFMLGIMVSFVMNIAAETMLSSEQVSYSSNKTSQTTVKGNLDELFSAVDINERLGSTDISAIGDGTITGALNTIDSNLSNLKSTNKPILKDITSLVYLAYQNRFVIINSRGEDVSNLVNATIPEQYRPDVNVMIPCYLSQISSPYVKAVGYVIITPSGDISCVKLNNYNQNSNGFVLSDYEVFFSGNYYV